MIARIGLKPRERCMCGADPSHFRRRSNRWGTYWTCSACDRHYIFRLPGRIGRDADRLREGKKGGRMQFMPRPELE